MASDPLTNLVAAWELTSGPQDSHTNALHFSVVGDTPSYSAAGAKFNPPTSVKSYFHKVSQLLDSYGSNVFVSVQIISNEMTDNINLMEYAQDPNGSYTQYGIYIQFHGGGFFSFSNADNNPFFPAGSVQVGVRTTIFAWTDGANYNIQSGDDAVYTLPISAGFDDISGELNAMYNYTFDDDNRSIRYLRVWIGPNAAKDSDLRTWLHNNGAGRAYSEFAGYVPPAAPTLWVPPGTRRMRGRSGGRMRH